MAHKKTDEKKRPMIPKDVTWQDALKKALLFIITGVILLPVGLVLYNVIPLSEDLEAVTFVFALFIFFGAILLFYGVLILILAMVQKRKSPPKEELDRIALAEGITCEAEVKDIRTKTLKTSDGEQTVYRYTLEFYDKVYEYRRRFYTDYITRLIKNGDKFTVYYFEDSNLGYYIDVD